MEKENANPLMSIQKSDKIFVAGHRGMVGSALIRALESRGFANLLMRDRRELDLTDSAAVAKFFAAEKPAVVILAAALSPGRNMLGGSSSPATEQLLLPRVGQPLLPSETLDPHL